MIPRAARIHRALVSVAAVASLGAASLGAASPEPRECPPDASERAAESRSQVARGQASYDSGAFVDAAESFAQAVRTYPECDTYHLRRVTALEQAVATYRELHGGRSERIGFIEKALALVDEYLVDLRARHGPAADTLEGLATATALRERLDSELSAGRPAVAPPPPNPTDDPLPVHIDGRNDDARRLKLGIGLSAGIAGAAAIAGIATMVAARRGGPLWTDIYARAIFVDAPSSATESMCAGSHDPELDALCARRAGLLAGAAISGVLVVAGVSTAAALGARLHRGRRGSAARVHVSPRVALDRTTAAVGGVLRF